MNLTIQCSPDKVTNFLLKVVGCLLLINLTGTYIRWGLGYDSALGFVSLFDFDQEYNIPAFYSAVAIFLCAALLWGIAKNEMMLDRKKVVYWKGLSFIFLFLSLDELIGVHNQFSRIIGAWLEHLPKVRLWIFAYLPLLLPFLTCYIKFFLKLPVATKIGFFTAGIVYITGAIGLEFTSGVYIYYYYSEGFNWGILIGILEELLEMLGIILFIRALISYFSNYSILPKFNLHINLNSKAEER